MVLGVGTRTVTEHCPRRVLDVGCGAGVTLAAMLDAAPEPAGTGIDSDPAAAERARQMMVDRGLADRGQVLRADLAELLEEGTTAPVAGRSTDVAALLAPRVTVLVISTAAPPHLVRRRCGLLLRPRRGTCS